MTSLKAPNPYEYRRELFALANQLADIYETKSADYGRDAFERTGGHRGVAVRMSDKMTRLENLVIKPLMKGEPIEAPKNEAIADTYIDMASYAIIAYMLLQKETSHAE